MSVFYNDHDPKACAWVRELIAAGALPAGAVSEEPIEELSADELESTSHFFSGIGGWAEALNLAGWPTGAPVWTASLPCQPFSQAGAREGKDDERHLWPYFRALVEQCDPPIIFGEQVASKDALGESRYVTKTQSLQRLLAEAESGLAEKTAWAWFPAVQADLEALGYIVGASDLPAASIGAPHIRQRLFWVAYKRSSIDAGKACRPNAGSWLRHTSGQGREGQQQPSHGASERERPRGAGADALDELGNANPDRVGQHAGELFGDEGQHIERPALEDHMLEHSGNGDWDNVVYIPCADGVARPLKPGLAPLVDGLQGRMALLRGYGNAIVPALAAAFVESVMECIA